MAYRDAVLRTALRPRWLALLVVVLVAATGMSLLGQWQLNRARERGGEQARDELSRVRPLAEVLHARQEFPASAVGQRVVAAGVWDGQRQQLVTGRRQDGRAGYWVLTPLRQADDSGVPVVRGWVPRADDPATAVPGGAVEVTGQLEPGEEPLDRPPGAAADPPGRLSRVAPVDLIDRWPYPLITGYVILTGQRPPASGSTPRLVTPPAPETGLNWQNLSYAVQWWIFAGFGLFLWWRLVRDDHLDRLGRVTMVR